MMRTDARTRGTQAWHTGLVPHMTWTQIGALSRRHAERGALADARTEHALQCYDMRHVDTLLTSLDA